MTTERAVSLVPWGGSVEMKLSFMRHHGSSVLLSWGEGNGVWDCSWITSGVRHVGLSVDMALAVHRALQGGAGDAARGNASIVTIGGDG
jgi:hypothetical protein